MSLPILQIVHRPGVIDLGWGHPDPGLMPVEAVRRACDAALDRFGPEALLYGYSAGPGPLIEWLSARIGQREGRTPAGGEIMMTGGNSLALDQVLTLCTTPGDTVLVESPTYHLAIRILRDHPLNLLSVSADQDGLRVEALAETLAGLKRSGRRARALYTVPTFNNPTGVSLSEARRKALVELAASEEFLIIEDDVYRELAYDAPAPPSLWSIAPTGVVARMGSFSKSLAPGVRLGWLTAGADLIARLVKGGMLESGGGINHFAALVVAALCEAGDYDIQVARLRTAYRARRDTLLASLRGHLPEACAALTPGGGFFVWVGLPDGWNSISLLPRAESAGVSYVPGKQFYLDGRGEDALRLAFSLYPPETLAEAARRLGQAIKSPECDVL